MSRIARSPDPLYQTRGRPITWPVTMTELGGGATDLTGAGLTALLRWADKTRPLTAAATPPATGGKIQITGPAVPDLPEGRIAELVLTVTDSQGGVTDFIWPVVGEIL